MPEPLIYLATPKTMNLSEFYKRREDEEPLVSLVLEQIKIQLRSVPVLSGPVNEDNLMMCSLEELETMLQHAEEALIDALRPSIGREVKAVLAEASSDFFPLPILHFRSPLVHHTQWPRCHHKHNFATQPLEFISVGENNTLTSSTPHICPKFVVPTAFASVRRCIDQLDFNAGWNNSELDNNIVLNQEVDDATMKVRHVFPLQAFKQLRYLNSPPFSFFKVFTLNNRDAFCSQTRRAHNQTRLTRQMSGAGGGFDGDLIFFTPNLVSMVFISCRLAFVAVRGQNPMKYHHTPQLSQVNSVHITSTLTLAQLGDIIGQSCLTSFHTPSSLPQHQLFVLHPTQCTDNHNIKEQTQRKIREQNRHTGLR
ncbi:hypothetical protein BLNAU_19640 [Blattamonas nauphoetae]|uniref:Uncharacterized protein n=1 Tax=Blattamonas nauphoetae TaxID=2049346 RepID=A0ABQ9X1F8_9EUKA|nr:hypothetical protein BLNAU_19640 [Blattamonas nauphoetae]